MSKKFILGIGSQRAGSTLLANLLNQHPLIELHPLKELHYFDTLFGFREQNVLKEFSAKMLSREIDQLIDSHSFNFISDTWKWYIDSNWKLFIENVKNINYLDLYNEKFINKNVLYTGESTPEYMLLNEEHISVIRNTIGNAYIILICRNPIKRILSAFNLLIEYQAINLSNEELDELFDFMIENNDFWVLIQIAYSNYVQTIERYTKYFNKFLYLSYDDITDNPDKILMDLTNFLGIKFERNNYLYFLENRINSFNIRYKATSKIFRKLELLFESQNNEIVNLFGKPLIL